MRLFGTPLEEKIFKRFALFPERSFFIAELARKENLSVGTIHATIQIFLKDKFIILTDQKGKVKLYRLNSTNPVVRQLKVLMVVFAISDFVMRIAPYTKKIFLFGSCARGEQTNESDIDLLVVTQDSLVLKNEVMPKKLPITMITKTPSQWAEMEKKDPDFYREVIEGGITLIKNI
ncbi:MAG: nucleotidyltransferase domain-containing protein [bacterium]|nr:nucleotidyltransferase domain-containing protein [bacterium]